MTRQYANALTNVIHIHHSSPSKVNHKMWLLERAKKKIVKCMFRTEAVPMNNVRLHYIKNTICKATQAGTDNPGNVNVQYICINSTEIFISFLQLVLSLKIEGDVNNMMTAVQTVCILPCTARISFAATNI